EPQPATLALAMFAPGDAEKPRTEGARRIEAADMFPGKDKTFLRQIVGVGRIAAEPPQKGPQSLLVHLDQPPESGSRTGPGVLHPGRFGGSVRHRGGPSRSEGGRSRRLMRSDRPLLSARATKMTKGIKRPKPR